MERFIIPDVEEISRLSEMTPHWQDLLENIEPYLLTNEMIVAIKAFANSQSNLIVNDIYIDYNYMKW